MSTTPRIDGTLLEQYKNRTVRVIGRVENIDRQEVTLYTPSTSQDELNVTVNASPDLEFQAGYWYEIIARVTDELSLRAIDIQNFGQSLNEKAVAGLVHFSHKTPEVFYDL